MHACYLVIITLGEVASVRMNKKRQNVRKTNEMNKILDIAAEKGDGRVSF